MEQVLILREEAVKFFKRYEVAILFGLRFLAGVFVFSLIGGIGYSLPQFDFFKGSLIFVMLMGLFTAVLPVNGVYLLIIANVGIQLSSYYEIAFVVVLALLLILLFYSRLAPKEGILIILTFFGFYFNVPYIVPILSGLYFGLTAIIPVSIGVFLWQFMPIVKGLISAGSQTTEAFDLMEAPKTFFEIYSNVTASLTSNTDWIVISFIFAMVILVVYSVSRQSISYSRQVSIALGGLVNIACFVIAILFTNVDKSVDIFSLIIFTILSCAVMVVVTFFEVVLDYRRAERVMFEDDDNYYFVKVVPKVIMTQKRKPAKRIRPEVNTD